MHSKQDMHFRSTICREKQSFSNFPVHHIKHLSCASYRAWRLNYTEQDSSTQNHIAFIPHFTLFYLYISTETATTIIFLHLQSYHVYLFKQYLHLFNSSTVNVPCIRISLAYLCASVVYIIPTHHVYRHDNTQYAYLWFIFWKF